MMLRHTITPSLLMPLCFAPLLGIHAEPGAPRETRVDFRREILPVLSTKCYHCHGPDEHSREAKLRLDVREDAVRDRSGLQAIVPGDPAKSELIARIMTDDMEELMPPPKHDKVRLTQAEVETFKRWIAQGANYEQHWSFVKPVAQEPPALPPGAKARNAIDHFITSAAARAGLAQAPEADAWTLLRRVSLDLTGLPPTRQDVELFQKDAAPGAYERAVDRLLASPHYGEKWARMWLDLARYADSTGYGSDKFRMNIWPYRDWVISAFNRNMPYDQFTIEQLAGDLLPGATAQQIAATAFHRNTMTQTEGGTDDEEYRVAAVKDRVGTTMQVWMGLTANCAQCHTHKFDPISHKEYYQLFAIFNQTEDSDRENEEPKMPLPTKEQAAKQTELRTRIEALEKQMQSTTPDLEAEQHEWEAAMHAPVTWEPLKPATARAASLANVAVLPDASVQASAMQPKADFYTVTIAGPLKGLTALSIEALLNSETRKGPGRFDHGNFVLSELRASVARSTEQALRGRFVRVEHQPKAILHLAEIEVFAGGENIARKANAKLSTTGYNGHARRLVDGRTDGAFDKGSVAHTADDDPAPAAEIDLGGERDLTEIVLWNRTDGDTAKRIAGAQLVVLDSSRKQVFAQTLKAFDREWRVALREEKVVALQNASATLEQKDFLASAAIDGSPETGWAIGGGQGHEQRWVAEFAKPVDVPEGHELIVTLNQKYPEHTLGRFRLSATTKPHPVRELPTVIREALALEPTERSEEQRKAVRDAFRPQSRTLAAVRKELDARKAELASIKPVGLPIMRERPADKMRKTHIFNKGNFLAPGDEVQPAVLASFGPAPEGAVNRLTLARWIMSPENPLTARVAVNRFWAQIFGTGLTEVEEDFGTQGQFPTHPELLDWLAVQFQMPKTQGGLGWDVKALLRLIVTSQTYRQDSRTSEITRQKDPRNQWLTAYPRRRLEAEAIRDQALLLAGLLTPKIGGPSVYPPQPDGLWSVAFNGGQNNYPTSKGEDRWRRGIYTFWRRTAPNPTMFTFDAPSRETCTIRRVPTNTPLQAFVTLNDPVFVEAAQALARRILREAPGDSTERLRWALQTVLVRPAQEGHVEALQTLLEKELAHYRNRSDEAKKLAASAELSLPAGADAAELAAWTVVANVLLNLDGILMKS